MSDRKALTNSNPEVLANEKEEKYSNDEYDQLITTLNPSSDIQGSFQLTGLYVDRIYNKINKVYVDLKNNESTTRRVGQRMDVIKTSLLETLDKRYADHLLNNCILFVTEFVETFVTLIYIIFFISKVRGT